MLDEKALRALDKLEILSREKLATMDPQIGWSADKSQEMLRNVPSWIWHVREAQKRGNFDSGTEGCLENLRKVVRHFKFDLKD